MKAAIQCAVMTGPWGKVKLGFALGNVRIHMCEIPPVLLQCSVLFEYMRRNMTNRLHLLANSQTAQQDSSSLIASRTCA